MIVIMSDFAARLRSLSSNKLALASGEQLFRAGDRVERVYHVLEGEIVLERFSADGGRLILQRARANDVIAEAAIFARQYHCDATSVVPSVVTGMLLSQLELASRSDPGLMEALARHLARELQKTRFQVEILSRHKVSDRLDAWLLSHESELPEKGRWLILSHEIGVTPEALYRELARRRRSNG